MPYQIFSYDNYCLHLHHLAKDLCEGFFAKTREQTLVTSFYMMLLQESVGGRVLFLESLLAYFKKKDSLAGFFGDGFFADALVKEDILFF